MPQIVLGRLLLIFLLEVWFVVFELDAAKSFIVLDRAFLLVTPTTLFRRIINLCSWWRFLLRRRRISNHVELNIQFVDHTVLFFFLIPTDRLWCCLDWLNLFHNSRFLYGLFNLFDGDALRSFDIGYARGLVDVFDGELFGLEKRNLWTFGLYLEFHYRLLYLDLCLWLLGRGRANGLRFLSLGGVGNDLHFLNLVFR